MLLLLRYLLILAVQVVLLKDGARIVTAIALRMIHASRVRIIQVCVHDILLMIFKQAVQASGALSER
jgi:hypothetical protein